MTTVFLYVILGAGAVGSFLLLLSIRVFGANDRAVITRLGRVIGVRGPGLFRVIPLLDRVVKVNMQTVALPIPHLEVITKDNVTLRVDAVSYLSVADPVRAVIGVDNYGWATQQAMQTALRSIIGRFELDELLAERDEVNQQLQQRVALSTEQIGIQVKLVEIREIEVPAGVRRAMERQAEAERELRAKVIYAQGESEAAESLTRTAAVLDRQPGAMQLKVLSTLADLAGRPGSTLNLQVPDLLRLVDRPRVEAEAMNGRR